MLQNEIPKKFKTFFIWSLGIHICGFIIYSIVDFFVPDTNYYIKSFGIQADLLSSSDIKIGNLPELKNEVLPQLPKQYQISDQEKKEDPNDMSDPEAKKKAEEEKKKVENENKVNQLTKQQALFRLQRQLALLKLQNKIETDDSPDGETSVGKGATLDNINSEEGKYISEVTNIVKGNWRYSGLRIKDKKDISTTVSIKISKQGKIYKKKIVESSTNRYFDEMVMDAITKSNPLPDPPDSIADKSLTLNFNPEG